MGIGTLRRHYDTDSDEPDAGALDADAFASDTALEVARDAGLTAADLEGVEPAGKTGYTASQIRELAGS